MSNLPKEFNPHIVVIWLSDNKSVYVKDYSYKQDAEEKYGQLEQLLAEIGARAKIQKIALAKIVKTHGEG